MTQARSNNFGRFIFVTGIQPLHFWLGAPPFSLSFLACQSLEEEVFSMPYAHRVSERGSPFYFLYSRATLIVLRRTFTCILTRQCKRPYVLRRVQAL